MEFFTTPLIFLLPLSLLFILFLKHLIFAKHSKNSLKSIPPPSVSSLPILIHIFFHRRSIFEIAPILRRFHSLRGPILTLRLFPFSRPSIFISDALLAHSALVHHGSAFADRPSTGEPNRFLTADNCNISLAPYGPLWRLLRRNLSAETLHPSRIRLFAPARRWALQLLLDTLHSKSCEDVAIKESFRHANFFLLTLMCFGERFGEREISEIESLQVFLLGRFTSFNVFAFAPPLTKVLFRKRWEKIVRARRRQAEIFLPVIQARRDKKMEVEKKGLEYCYVDSLLEIRVPDDEGRGLTDDEMVSLCHEFLAAGTDTTTTALEWTMAELVRNQDLQSGLFSEIESLKGNDAGDIIEEEDLRKMPLVKAVIMESLRRHPPGHFVLPHSVKEDVVVDGFHISKGTEVHIAVADVNWDAKNWEAPMEFRPARFMAGGEGQGVDITGSKEIKMMPFGAGRRICPGYGLAMLHLEFFVANLVKKFVWKSKTGEDVDLSEKLEFTTVLKNPLRAHIIPRMKN